MITYTSPGGIVPGLCAEILQQSHTLIAGASGSGKSTLLHSLAASILRMHPASVQMILIDPKRVELSRYAAAPHTLIHATEPSDIVDALRKILLYIDGVYIEMQEENKTMYSGADVYVIIDELADLMTTQRKQITPLLQRIGQIGRAARVHLIAATQCPLAKIIPTEIKVNFSALVGLRTLSRAHSRNIIDVPGCETLPLYGRCLYRSPQKLEPCNVPYAEPKEINRLVEYWILQTEKNRQRR